MAINDLIACNKDLETKKVFKEAKDLMQKTCKRWEILHGFSDPEIKITIDLWKEEILGKKSDGEDAYIYCYINDKGVSKEAVDDWVSEPGNSGAEAWHDRLSEIFQWYKNINKLPKELQKYINSEDEYHSAGYAIILNGKRGY